ncbi:MAG: cysteine dioxygenase family protein [Saprospiraceae bacterium]
MNKIKTLATLIDLLDSSTNQQYKNLDTKIEIPIDQFSSIINFSKDHYTRHCIKRTENYELLLLCWDTDQGTPIHYHGGEDCWLYVLDGSIEEGRYKEENGIPQQVSIAKYYAGDDAYINDEIGFHHIANTGGQKSITLHIYMNPIKSCNVYDEDKKVFYIKEYNNPHT